jgi:hypothetical protein
MTKDFLQELNAPSSLSARSALPQESRVVGGVRLRG